MRSEIISGCKVSFRSRGETVHGRVSSVQDGEAKVFLMDGKHWGEERVIRVPRLTFEPPVTLSAEALRQFCRYEVSFTELMQGRIFADIDVPVPYQITLDDVKEAVRGCLRAGGSETEIRERLRDEYFFPLRNTLWNWIGGRSAMYPPDDEEGSLFWVPDQYSVFCDVWEMLFQVCEFGSKEVGPDDIVTEIQIWEDNQDRPLEKKEFSRLQTRHILECWNDELLKTADAVVKQTYRRLLDGLCAQDDRDALEKKAYACYGNGNAVYGQDWPASMACLLRLMEIDPNPRTANTLGYMYYYGRCNDGVPEYDKAFYYFSIGAAGGFYESRYKLSDMFRHGYGVAKNPEAAASLIREMYREQLKKFADGESDSNFADVALRAGDLCREGVGCLPSPDTAYYYYLQARCAIRRRMETTDNYGDRKVADGIEKAIAEVLPETDHAKPSKTVHIYGLNRLLGSALAGKRRMEMKIRRLSDTEARLTFRLVPYGNEKFRTEFLVTVPEAGYCEMVKQLSVTARGIGYRELPDGADTVVFDSVRGSELLFYGKSAAYLEADFVYRAPAR